MTDTVKISLCILWEGELRAAAHLLKVASELPDDDPGLQEAFSLAYNACLVALHGLTDEKGVVMLGSDSLRGSMVHPTSTRTDKA